MLQSLCLQRTACLLPLKNNSFFLKKYLFEREHARESGEEAEGGGKGILEQTQ